MNLDAYLSRIGYAGTPEPTLAFLTQLVARHPEAIPFENLDPLMGRPVRLDEASIERKLIHAGRGGYCFEHNLLLKSALEEIGFGVMGLAARVLWNQPEGTFTARGHMLLLVEVDGTPFVVDVGFGGQTPTAPLRLGTEVAQDTPHGPFRLLRAGEDFTLEAFARDAWRPLYRFDLQEQHRVDYEMSNWYVSTHPESHFVTGLIAGRAEPGRRYALRDNRLTIHHVDGITEQTVLDSPLALRYVLEELFRIRLPDAPELDAALDHLATAEPVVA